MQSDDREASENAAAETDETFAAAAAAVRADVGDEDAWDQLEDFAAATQRPDDVAALYREALSGSLSDGVASTIAQRAVQFHEEWFREDSPVLVEVLQRVLEVDPTASEWAFQRLTVVFTVGERWDELLALYDREIAAAVDEHRKATLLEEAAQTAKDFAGATDRAIGYLQQLLPLRPGDKQLASGLERLLERGERWEDLIALWRDRLPSLDDDAADERRLRIAELYVERLGKAAEAIEELRALSSDEATAMLERIAKDDALDADARREALQLLRERYTAEDRTTAVIATLDTALELADTSERIALHRDAAERLRAAGAHAEAMEHLGDVLRLAPDDEEALLALREVAAQAGEQRRMVDYLIAAADAAEAIGERATLRLEGAEQLVRLGEPETALPQLKMLAEAEEIDGETARAAARLWEEQLGAAGRREEQLGAVERLAQLEDTPSRRRAALGRAAHLAAELEEADRALALWEQRLEEDPEDAAALGELIALLEREERWAELVRALRRRADGPTAAWQKRADLIRVARVQAEKLEQLADAIATWNEVASGYGEDASVADALVDLYERTERYEEMAAVLDRTSAREETHLAMVRARQGDAFGQYLGDPARALTSYGRALEAEPDHAEARAGLARLCEHAEVGAEAVEALAKSYERTGEWAPLLALLEQRLAGAETASRRVALLREAATIQENESEAPAAALGSIGRALAEAPEDESLEADLLRLAEATGEWAAAADALRDAAPAAEPVRQAALRTREAGIRQDRVEDLEGAFAAAVVALREVPLREAFAERVVTLAGATGDLATAEEALSAAADHPHAPIGHLEKLAAIQRRQVEEEAEGIRPRLFATLMRLAALKPKDLDVLYEAAALAVESLPEQATATLESLYERASGLWRGGAEVSGERGPDVLATWAAEQLVGRYDADEKASEAIELLMDASRLPMAPNDAATWRREAARRAAEAGEATTAIELYRDVLRSNEEDVEAMKALGDLLDAAGRRAELLTLRHQELAKVESPERRVELRLDIARIVTEIERTGGRMEALRANLDEMPGHPASLESLEELLVARRGYEELAEVLEAQAARVEPERAGVLWARVAGLAEGPLDDVDRAVEAHRKVVEIDPEKVASLDALARIHRERGEAAAASRWLERRLAVAGEDERADLAMELGKALVDAGRADRAAEVLEKALADAPARQDLRDLLAEQYRALEAWEPLAGVLTASAEHAEDQETVLALVREAADLYRDALKRPAEAIPVLRKGAGLAPDDRAIKLQLAEGLQEAGELDEARALLTEVVDAFGRRRSPERAQVHYQLGVVCRAQGDLDAALEQLERATKMAMAEPRMLQMLGRLATEADQLERAEKAYRALLMTVRRQGPAERLDVASGEVLYELHAIAKRRGDDNAGELLESALEAAAQNDAEALRFQEALTERGDAELALKALERRAKAAESASSKATMHAAMAEVLMALDRPAEALDAQLAALREDPARTELQDGALTMAREVGAEEKVTAVFRELVETHQRDEDAALRASLFVHLGEVAEKAGDLDEATSLYGRAEALSDEPVRAWQALARVGAAREDAPLQKRVLAELVEVEDLTPAERADVLHQYARVLLADPTQLDDAVPVARRAFDAEPRSAELAAALDAATERRPDHDEALRLYEEVARDSGDERVLLRFLVRRGAREDATLQQLREACEKAQALAAAEPEPAPELEEGEEEDPAEAEARAAREARRQEVAAEAAQQVEPLLARAVSVAEASEEGITAARWAMRGMAEARAAAGDTPGALEWMQRVVDTAEHEDERRELQRQLAEVAAGEGGDLEIAGDVYQQLLELDPTDATIWRPLLQVYIRQENEDRLNDLVIQLIDALLEPSLRNEARLAKAKFLMGMEGREFDAVDLLKAALEEEPDHAEAAELLASLYEKSGYDEDLVELLERQLDVARDHQDLEQISELTLRLGALLEKVRREDAVDVYRRALDWVPKDRAIIEAYLRVLGDEDDPREKVEVRERLLSVETGDAASELARQLYAEWQALEDADGMLRALDLGYRGNPEDAELRGWLEAALREREDWERLADFLGLEAARLAESDPETAVAKLREAAALKRDTLGDAAGAVELLRQARRATGSVEVLQELVDTLRAAGDLEAAAEEVGQALEAHEAQDATYVHLVTLRARLNLDRDEVDAALADLEAGYPLAADVVREDLARALARKAETAPDAESERAATMRLVEIRGEVDPAAAREVLAGWVEGHPDDVEALQRLRQVDVSTQNWPGVVATCDKLVRVLEGPEQVEAAMLLADAAEAAEVPAEAKAGLELSFQANPANPQVIERLRGLYEQIGAHRELAQLLAHEASTADAERAFELYRRAGKVLIEDVGDADAALPMLQRAVDAKPDDHRTTVLLADAYIGSGYYAEAGQLLEQAIGQQTRRRSPELSQLQHRMARLAKAAGDRNLEMQWLNAALDSDKNNGHVAAELASLAWELGELDLALNALRAVTLSKSEDGPMSRAEAFLMQAKIAHQKGEGRRALLWARKAKSEDPQLEEAQAFLEQLGDG